MTERQAKANLPKKPKQETPKADVPAGGYHSFPACHEITGYMPSRDEFETVFDNDAEVSIKDLSIAGDDPSSEVRIKRCMLDIYSGTLDRRQARHGFSRQHQLLTSFKAQVVTDKARTKEEKEVWQALKPFARFLLKEDMDELYAGLVKEAELRKRIASLQEYRRAGIRKLDEVSRYEAEKKQLVRSHKLITASILFFCSFVRCRKLI